MEMFENENSVVVLNAQPEFTENDTEEISAKFFIFCEQNDEDNLFEADLCGMPVISWVKRACPTAPMIVKVRENQDVLETIKPYTSGADYSVVLYANTPLVSRQHLIDLLGFVSRRHMNACKLKKGYVFRNEYIENVDEIYSIDTYDFASNDFFEVKTFADLEKAKELLISRICDYHKRNGVSFGNSKLTNLDASVEIGYGSFVGAGSNVLQKSKLANNVKLAENVVIKNSKIGEDVVILSGAIIIDSIVKSGAKIGEGVVLKGSIVHEEASVEAGCVISRAAVREGAVIGTGSRIVNAKVGKFAHVKEAVTIVGDGKVALVEEHTMIKPAKKIVVKVENDSEDDD